MDISMRLKELMEYNKVSIPQLAKATQIPISTIKNYLYKNQEPRSAPMQALERYFNVSGAYLRGEEDAKSGRGFTFRDDNEPVTLESLLASFNKMVKLKDNAIDAEIETLKKIDDFPLLALNLARIFATLSKEGQMEMFKRMEEYAVFDRQRQKEKTKNAQKNSRPEDDSESTYTIAAENGTRMNGTRKKEVSDEISALPFENPDL